MDISFIYFSKSSVILFLFFILCSFVFYQSIQMDLMRPQTNLEEGLEVRPEGSWFLFVNYYNQDREGPINHLTARYLNIQEGTGVSEFISPQGEAYNGVDPLSYKANHGTMWKKEKWINLSGDVVLWDRLSEIKSDKAKYNFNKDYFEAHGNVRSSSKSAKTQDKILINSQDAVAWPMDKIGHYSGNVNGKVVRAKPYETGVDFKAKQISVDLNKSYIELIENVYLKKELMEAFSLRGEIFLDNYNKKLKYYALYDDVKIIEKVPVGGGVAYFSQRPAVYKERRAYSEKLEGFAQEGKVILTGYPKVIQDKDIIKGNIITLLKENEVIEVDDSTSSFTIKK